MTLAIIALVIILLLVAIIQYRQRLWHHETNELVRRVKIKTNTVSHHVNLAEVDALPSPVKRYFHHVLKPGLPIIQHAHMQQAGGFVTRLKKPHWSSLSAQQWMSAQPNGFIWDAKITVLPLLSIYVRDTHLHSRSRMHGQLLSLIKLFDFQATPELATAALQRILAERVWMPTALLPSQGVQWTAINKYVATATLQDGNVSAALDFEFNQQGEIIRAYTAGRYREVKGQFELTPWEGQYANYTEIEGYRVPTAGEVAWVLADAIHPYWKATIKNIQYDY